jgi:hypothetical protein
MSAWLVAISKLECWIVGKDARSEKRDVVAGVYS